MKRQQIRIGVIDPDTGQDIPTIDDSTPIVYTEDPTATWNSDYTPPANEVPVTTSTDPGSTTTENKVNWMLVIALAVGIYLLRKK